MGEGHVYGELHGRGQNEHKSSAAASRHTGHCKGRHISPEAPSGKQCWEDALVWVFSLETSQGAGQALLSLTPSAQPEPLPTSKRHSWCHPLQSSSIARVTLALAAGKDKSLFFLLKT